MMEFLKDNWTNIIFVAFMAAMTIPVFVEFKGKPRAEQIKAIKEWLVYAVTEAETELGSGTGQLKIRMVYDMFVTKFPWAAKVIAFNTFSFWVDEALVVMREMLEKNIAVQTLVLGNQKTFTTDKATA